MIRKTLPLLILAIMLVLGSCASRKKMVYFQGEDNSEVQLPSTFTPIFEVGDLLSVEITGAEDDIIAPYNQPELVRQGNQISSYENGVPATYGYLIFTDSTISLPIIGKVKVGGLNRQGAVEAIENALSEHLETPQVSIRMLNFKITILGEVENPGTFSIPNERITLIEAIGISGDLKTTAKRKNILVIRNEKGVKKEYRVDLTSKDLFQSPVYYLKQNDVVYIEPNRKTRYDSSIWKSAGGIILSATTLFITTVTLITK